MFLILTAIDEERSDETHIIYFIYLYTIYHLVYYLSHYDNYGFINDFTTLVCNLSTVNNETHYY
jgi:hypothetical protein